MFGKLIRFLDSLFYTKLSITTVEYFDIEPVVKDIESDDIVDDVDVLVKPASIEFKDASFCINGRDVAIPDIVIDRPPLILESGPNYDSFPSFRYADVHISFISETKKFASVNGEPVSRSHAVGGWTRKKILECHLDCTKFIDENQGFSQTHLGELTISFCLQPEWAYLSILRDDGSFIQIHQDNERQFETDQDCIVASYAYARFTLLTYLVVGHPDGNTIDEDDLATTILALILADRL